MATKTILDSTLTAIADAIRQKTGDSGSMTPLEMPEEIENIPTGGGGDTLDEVLLSHTATSYTNNTVTVVGAYAFYGAQNLISVSLTEVTTIQMYAFYACANLKNVYIPKIQHIGSNVFQASGIEEMTLPASLSLSDNSTFASMPSLKKIAFSGHLSTIPARTFQYDNQCTEYNFSHCTSVPALTNVNAFSGINANAKIVVPDALYNDWIAETNWSTYASYIVKASEA